MKRVAGHQELSSSSGRLLDEARALARARATYRDKTPASSEADLVTLHVPLLPETATIAERELGS